MQTGLQTAESAGQCWSTSERGLFESKNREARRSEPNPVDRETDIIFPCSQKEVLQNAQIAVAFRQQFPRQFPQTTQTHSGTN